jgi:hypothetical protein
VSGLEGLAVVAKQPVEVGPASTQGVAVALRVDPAGKQAGAHAITFHVEDVDAPEVIVREKSRFFIR